ncbi:hypothetical protein QR98_0017700 [Sarcoptes scabiei]|uniref:Uncharacterized protein n=1 Tax=Sarcoptes scabiei TaxID=52283 RepID=A0A131ZXW2_SARSC|nr:hypothetical protein QR98_0017700 [Sarcoptes scabiei]
MDEEISANLTYTSQQQASTLPNSSNSLSRTIYHPIYLIKDDIDIGFDEKDVVDNQKLKAYKTSPPPSLSNQSNHIVSNTFESVTEKLNGNLLKASPSSTPSPSIGSNCNSGADDFPNEINLGKSLHRDADVQSENCIKKEESKSTPIESGLENPMPLISLSSSSSTSTSVSSAIKTSTTYPLLTTVAPICTVAFVPSINTTESKSITATMHSATQSVPIASCKGNIVEVDVVTVGHYQPGYEETKPFTMSDFYKYSQRFRHSQKNPQSKSSDQSARIDDVQTIVDNALRNYTDRSHTTILEHTISSETITESNKSDDNNNRLAATPIIYS